MGICTSIRALQLLLMSVYCLSQSTSGPHLRSDPLIMKTLNLHGDEIADIKNIIKQLVTDNQVLKNTVNQLKLENTALQTTIQNFGSNFTQCCSRPISHPVTTTAVVTKPTTHRVTNPPHTRPSTTHNPAVTQDPLTRCYSRLHRGDGPIQTDGKYCYQLLTLQLTSKIPSNFCTQIKSMCHSRGGYLSMAESDVLNSKLVPNNSYVIADEPHRRRRFMFLNGCVMWQKNSNFNIEIVGYIHTTHACVRAILQLDL